MAEATYLLYHTGPRGGGRGNPKWWIFIFILSHHCWITFIFTDSLCALPSGLGNQFPRRIIYWWRYNFEGKPMRRSRKEEVADIWEGKRLCSRWIIFSTLLPRQRPLGQRHSTVVPTVMCWETVQTGWALAMFLNFLGIAKMGSDINFLMGVLTRGVDHKDL